LDHAPDLTTRREATLAIVKPGNEQFMKKFIAEQGSGRLKEDREVMLTVIQRDAKIFAYVSPQLKRNTEIIMAAIGEEFAADVLAAVGQEALRTQPEIVVRAISVYPQKHLRILWSHVPDELCNNRGVVVAYISSQWTCSGCL
jgi:hypothetical protein